MMQDHMTSQEAVGAPSNPTDDLLGAINELRATADELSGVVSRCHSTSYGEFQFTPSPTLATDGGGSEGRVASLAREVREIRSNLQSTLQVAASLESNA